MTDPKLAQDKRIRRTKKLLRESLVCLLKEKDLKDITITDIVQQADINRGTFYKHYQYKEDLLGEVIDEVLLDLVDSYREPYRQVDTFVVGDMVVSTIKIFEHIAQYANFYEIVLKTDMLPGVQTKICNELKKLPIQDLVNTQQHNHINQELQSSYYAYAILGMIIEWVNEDFQHSPRYMAEQLLEIMKYNSLNVVYKINQNQMH
ncbi:TetR/AcrR family transcriptional regulator [Paenibacillus kribbensis]|uniref:TetR/AcrR family transcriptional regulator n=1 Tax=Paenibacillus kribbensis TaxID=172713 RepID=UPI0008397DB4|nr:TetR/AcrR family transcriptional regulator [Paenibacillus kribbensis]